MDDYISGELSGLLLLSHLIGFMHVITTSFPEHYRIRIWEKKKSHTNTRTFLGRKLIGGDHGTTVGATDRDAAMQTKPEKPEDRLHKS